MNTYGFSVKANSEVELTFNTDGDFIHYYLYFNKEGYPRDVYAKVSLEGEVLEMYPYYMCDNVETSMNVFFGKEKYEKEKFPDSILHNWGYSYDGKKISHIYKIEDLTYRYNIDTNELDTIGLEVFTPYIDEVLNFYTDCPNVIKEKIQFYRPDYYILYMTPDKILKKVMLGFFSSHPKYREVINTYNLTLLKDNC